MKKLLFEFVFTQDYFNRSFEKPAPDMHFSNFCGFKGRM